MDSATIDYLYGLQIVSYFDAAFFTFLTWDTVANFGNEYAYIWRSPSSFIKFLYLWTRYGTFFDTLLPILRWNVAIGASSCLIVSKFQGIFTAFGIAITEAILMVRTYALYERSKNWWCFSVSCGCPLSGSVYGLPSTGQNPDSSWEKEEGLFV
ncbi:hypothetical protein B0H16DRAFT_888843 [Mycena metata]|uniref:DUF6533 domain-containing protein n=1 Tax=Mycena metata TaxID=1033252 RepID=A0AAD7NW78_9AGAR|nr:hypothetical protein B0H16DRAFT_888843 [Mycena metata]